MDKEYIERETALKIIDNYSKTVNEDGKAIVKSVRDIVDFICPTADMQEVRHGKWEQCFEDWRNQIEGDKCSVCGFEHYGTSIRHYPYCPNCGAKMDNE